MARTCALVGKLHPKPKKLGMQLSELNVSNTISVSLLVGLLLDCKEFGKKR